MGGYIGRHWRYLPGIFGGKGMRSGRRQEQGRSGCKRCNTEGHRNPIHSNQIQEDPFSTSGEKLNDNGSGYHSLSLQNDNILHNLQISI